MNVILLILLLFFVSPKISVANRSSTCSPPLKCLSITNCKPLMAVIKTTQNSPAIIKFLKGQICSRHTHKEPKVCCPSESADHKDTKKQLDASLCKSSFRCVGVSRCGPLMYLVNLEKPVPAGVIKFIKSQQCGAGKSEPKVCCKLGEVQTSPSGVATATERVFSTSTVSLKEKAEAMNKLFNDGFFDYDFFVRR